MADWTWHQGAIAGCNGRGATAGFHRRVPLNVLWLGGDNQLGGVDVVPLLGAIECAMVGGEGDDQLGGVDVIAGCHCRVPLNVLWLGGRVTTNLGEWT